MQNRREFLKVAGLATVGAGLGLGCSSRQQPEARKSGPARMELRFYPYELQLQHTFTVSSYSRKTTPDVQVEIDYQGYT